jgi:hypothetical protein
MSVANSASGSGVDAVSIPPVSVSDQLAETFKRAFQVWFAIDSTQSFQVLASTSKGFFRSISCEIVQEALFQQMQLEIVWMHFVNCPLPLLAKRVLWRQFPEDNC